ncbi:hypothetical protein [Rothia nasimurium]|uniref:hypothetical protein n=1 Tax=Rothia nasimurium TaxID=85336 RepID=UPI001F31309E|nr:hypothetical protein [Rothia nasimurium]
MAAAGGANWAQYRDGLSKESVGTSKVTKDLPQDAEAQRKLKLINDGLEQNLRYQKIIFWVIVSVVIASLVAIVVLNSAAAIGGTHLAPAVLISFNASIAVQAFLLLNVVARSLFPAPGKQAEDKAEDK